MKEQKPAPRRKQSALEKTARISGAVMLCACLLFVLERWTWDEVAAGLGFNTGFTALLGLLLIACVAFLVLFCCLTVLLFRYARNAQKRSVWGLIGRIAVEVLFFACFLCFLIGFLLDAIGLQWRPWVQEALFLTACAALLVLLCCFIALLFRYAANRRELILSQRIWCGLGGVMLSLAVPVYCCLVFLGGVLMYRPEYELLQNGEPVVAYYISGWLNGGNMYVCGDRGPFLMTSESEKMGWSNDPFADGITLESFEWR